MRILVCGGRHFANVHRTQPTPAQETIATQERIAEYKWVHECLNSIVCSKSKEYSETENWLPTDIVIIEGGATGVDSAAWDFAICNFCQHEQYPADWKKYGKRAGYIRNVQMLKEGKPDLVVAFPGGKGTQMMVSLAVKAGIPVYEFSQNERTSLEEETT